MSRILPDKKILDLSVKILFLKTKRPPGIKNPFVKSLAGVFTWDGPCEGVIFMEETAPILLSLSCHSPD